MPLLTAQYTVITALSTVLLISLPYYRTRMHTPYIHPYTHPPSTAMARYVATAAVTQPMCKFWAESGVTCLSRRDISQREVLKIVLFSVSLFLKQPLCARQNAFS